MRLIGATWLQLAFPLGNLTEVPVGKVLVWDSRVFVFPLCACTCLARDHFLCCTVYLKQSPLLSLVFKHTLVFQIILKSPPLQAVLLTLCVCVCVCVLILCFVMGYVLKFGEIAHKKIPYYYTNTPLSLVFFSDSWIEGQHAETQLLLSEFYWTRHGEFGAHVCLHRIFVLPKKTMSLLLFLNHVNFWAVILWKCIIWRKGNLSSPWVHLLKQLCCCFCLVLGKWGFLFTSASSSSYPLSAVLSCIILMMQTAFGSKR